MGVMFGYPHDFVMIRLTELTESLRSGANNNRHFWIDNCIVEICETSLFLLSISAMTVTFQDIVYLTFLLCLFYVPCCFSSVFDDL